MKISKKNNERIDKFLKTVRKSIVYNIERAEQIKVITQIQLDSGDEHLFDISRDVLYLFSKD